MLNLQKLKYILCEVCSSLISREHELCKFDSIVGDGDHGVTVKRGFSAVKDGIETAAPDSIYALLSESGYILMDQLGGAIGPVLASLFLGMAASTKGKESIGTADLARMFSDALTKVMDIGGAKPGDRTLVDALAPAVATLAQCTEMPEKEAMMAAAKSAYEGAQSTKDMVAQKGRAHFLGEKSKGYVDAGAMTMYYFIESFAEAI